MELLPGKYKGHHAYSYVALTATNHSELQTVYSHGRIGLFTAS